MKIDTKRRRLSVKRDSPLLQSHDDKITTDKLHRRIANKIRDKRENSPKTFKIGLIAILGFFILLIVGFVGVQSQGSTEANAYKSKINAYLEAVYNASTVNNDNPFEIAKLIESIDAPKLGGVPLGIFSYSYMSAQMIQNNINNQVQSLIDVVNQNGQFYEFYNGYMGALSEISNLSYGRGSDKLQSLTQAKAKYQDLADKVKQAKLPTGLQTSQNNIGADLTSVGEAVTSMADALRSGDNSSYALSSYKYSLASDKLYSDFADMGIYNGEIKERLQLASASFNNFRKTLE